MLIQTLAMTKSTLLRNVAAPATLSQRLHALRLIKNDLIGNRPRKDAWQRAGLLQLLVDILRSSPAPSAKGQIDETQIILYAVNIIGSILQDNVGLTKTAEASLLYQILLKTLETSYINTTIMLATLRTLNGIANEIQSRCDLDKTEDRLFGEVVYSPDSLRTFNQLLRQTKSEDATDRCADWIARLLVKTCNSEVRQNRVLEHGILAALTTRLARDVRVYQARSKSIRLNDPPQTRRVGLVHNRSQTQTLLQAVSIVIQSSAHRARYFLNVMTDLLIESATKGILPAQGRNAKEVPGPIMLGSLGQIRGSRSYELGFNGSIAVAEAENKGFWLEVVLHWLLSLTRHDDALIRLMSIWTVMLSVRCGCFSQDLENSIVASLVSPAVQLLQLPLQSRVAILNGSDSGTMSTDLQIVTYAPSVIAALVKDDVALQASAFEAGLVTQLVTLLKQCNETLPQGLHRLYGLIHRIDVDNTGRPSLLSLSTASYAGSEALKTLCLNWSFRQALLRAIAAMASREDEYRKAIIEQGAVPLIIDCLQPLDKTILTNNDKRSSSEINFRQIGNPACVLRAACEASKTLCRSVSVLRTSLSDSSLALPLVALLKDTDIEVQIAATAAVCNILLEFSPMREIAVNADVIRTLCLHARSVNLKLKLNSLWALKHMIHSAPNALKIECLNNLGPKWLEQAFEPFAEEEVSCFGGVSPDWSMRGHSEIAEGLKIPSHSLNDPDEEQEEVHMIEEPPNTYQPSRASDGSISDQGPRDCVRYSVVIEDTSAEQTIPTLNQDGDLIAVREQALDVIRNLLSGPSCGEMADYVTRELGDEETVLRFAGLLETSSDYQDSSGTAHMDCKTFPGNLTMAILCIICNFAGALPRHRQLIVTNERLMRRLLPLFRHDNAEVRKICVWIIINLTWVNDEEDRISCRSRAHELKKFGVLEELERLVGDPDQDVRERVKTAIKQSKDSLGA